MRIKDKIKHQYGLSNCLLASLRRKCERLYFVRDDASEKEADAEDNGAKEGDGQGYVLY